MATENGALIRVMALIDRFLEWILYMRILYLSRREGGG